MQSASSEAFFLLGKMGLRPGYLVVRGVGSHPRSPFATEVELQDAVNPRSEVCSLPAIRTICDQLVVNRVKSPRKVNRGGRDSGAPTRLAHLGVASWVYDFRAWSRPGTT